MFEKLKKNQAIEDYRRIWPYVKPYWGRALAALLITLPIGALDAIIALALKPFMDTVIVGQGGDTPFL